MFNAFETTSTRFKKQKTTDSPATAGAAKVATVTARSKTELKEWGERMNLVPRKLSMTDIRSMSSQEMLWHESENSENYKAALELPSKLAEGKEIDSQWKAHRFWNDTASPEEYKTLLDEFKKFLDHYPQYLTTTTHYNENNDVLFAWLQDRHMAPIYANLVLAFETTAPEGRLWLNPSAISAGSEVELSGDALRRYPRLDKLLAAQKRPNVIDTQSADDFKASHKELWDTRVPPIITARNAKAEATAQHFQQAAANTARSGSTTLTDYPDEPSGYPSHPTKFSFRRLLDSLSAESYRKRMNEDPQFSAAVDKLNNGNK